MRRRKVNLPSHAAKRAESAVYRDNDAVDKTCAGAAQPDQSGDKFPWLTKTAGGRVGDNRLSPCCEIVVFIKQQAAVLFTHEKARRDGINPQSAAILLRQFHGQPASQI